jgi:hypothetical protein
MMAIREHRVALNAWVTIGLIVARTQRERNPVWEEARQAVLDGSLSEELAAKLAGMNRVVESLELLKDYFDVRLRDASARKIAACAASPYRGRS